MASDETPSHARPTRALDPRELADAGVTQWPLVMAALERVGPWATLAFRLGTIALLQSLLKEMSFETISPDMVAKARILVEALAHMPVE